MIKDWLKSNRVRVINVTLFFIFFLINISHYLIPVFSIPFYEDSRYFIWLIAKRLDLMFMMGIFYVNTLLPKEFKFMLLGCACVVYMSMVEILPFENNTIDLFTWSFVMLVLVVAIWAVIISYDLANNKYIHNMIMIETKNSYREVFDKYNETIKNNPELGDKEKLEMISEILNEAKNNRDLNSLL